MIDLSTLEGYCHQFLEVERFDDYCPNGLQVEANSQVRRLLTGVTACQALIDEAVAWKADLLLVHHGFFWKGEAAPIRGIKARRIASLLNNGISLLAYHLPLDAHAELGNNRQLAQQLGFTGPRPTTAAQGLLWQGRLPQVLAAGELAATISRQLGHQVLHIPAGRERIERIGWCTGAAQGYIEEAARLGLDAYLSGEISEPTVHLARELGIDYFAAGHHATERYGVQALGRHLAGRYGLAHRFVDIDNPV